MQYKQRTILKTEFKVKKQITKESQQKVGLEKDSTESAKQNYSGKLFQSLGATD